MISHIMFFVIFPDDYCWIESSIEEHFYETMLWILDPKCQDSSFERKFISISLNR